MIAKLCEIIYVYTSFTRRYLSGYKIIIGNSFIRSRREPHMWFFL